MRAAVLVWLVFLPLALYADNDFDREQIKQRISPVGKVRVSDDKKSIAPAESVLVEKKPPTEKVPGQAVYDQYCMVCHRDGLAGAPKFRVEEDWKPRLAKADIDTLTASVVKGLNAMPPKGTCFDCSEADLKAAVEYMIPQS